MRSLLVSVLLLVGCTAIRPLDGVDGGADASAAPDAGRVDAASRDAAIDAGSLDAGSARDAAVDGAVCSPGTRCEGDDLVTCGGAVEEVVTCEVACGGDPAACLALAPSNLPARIVSSLGSASLTVSGSGTSGATVLDTDTGEIVRLGFVGSRDPVRAAGAGDIGGIYFERIDGPPGAPALGVFVLGALDIPGAERVVATGGAALVLVADTVRIDGSLSVDARAQVSVVTTLRGAAAGREGAEDGGDGEGAGSGRGGGLDEGGAGGGFGSAGGDGGGSVGGPRGGASYGDATLVPLLAGSGGGGGGPGAGLGATGGGRGGAGGGAVQISAFRSLVVGASGSVSACGQGGRGGGTGSDSAVGGGGGGGSGGAILLESPSVTIDGAVGANGGAGGQGAVDPSTRGAAGQSGRASSAPARGSATSSDGGGGGDGSDPRGAAQDGGSARRGGGGGGGAGRIRINSLSGSGAFALLPELGSGSTIGTIALRAP